MNDNINIIKPLLNFEDEDKFYFLQIIQRKKDHIKGSIVGTNNNSRLIKPYYISSEEYLDSVYPEIKLLCEVFNARAGIDLNRRSFKAVGFEVLAKVARQLRNEDYFHVRKSYDTVCGSTVTETDKRWILDYDEDDLPYKEYKELTSRLNSIRPEGEKVIETIPSKNGLHIITSPFDVKQAEGILKDFKLSLHKRNPTNLYIP